MANIFKRFIQGIRLYPIDDAPELPKIPEPINHQNKEGSLFHTKSDAKIKAYIQGAVREIITNSQNQTLTNKEISATSNTIITAASGNLTSTTLNAALSELQTDVDSRVTTASNVGTGSGVFKQKSGSTLELKSLSAGSNITITEVGDSLQLSASGTIGVNDATTSVKGVLKLTGDLGGTADSPTVINATNSVKGIVKLAGDLEGTADLPTVVNATTSVKGIVKLAGDLGGTADLPKIIKPTSTVSLLNIDWSLGYIYYKEISANSTFTFSNLENGKTISLIIKNTGAATYNLVLPTVIKTASMDLTIQAGKQNVYTFIATSTSVYATAVTQMA